MAKRQNYTVVFKSDQTTVMNAMHQMAKTHLQHVF